MKKKSGSLSDFLLWRGRGGEIGQSIYFLFEFKNIVFLLIIPGECGRDAWKKQCDCHILETALLFVPKVFMIIRYGSCIFLCQPLTLLLVRLTYVPKLCINENCLAWCKRKKINWPDTTSRESSFTLKSTLSHHHSNDIPVMPLHHPIKK